MTKILDELQKKEQEKISDKRRQVSANVDQLWRLVRNVDEKQVSLDFLEKLNNEIVDKGNLLIPFQKTRVI